MVFINCTIENPAFTSQTKETLKTKQNEFGSTCKLSDKILKKINSSGILNVLLEFLKFKEETLLMKKTDGKKVNAIKGIPKLEDAEWAGTKKSKMCKLILTEGDSAKALAMSGRAVVGNQKYGIFPLKGKLLNVRGASPKELLNNEEIINLKKILGLKHGKIYVNSGKEAKETKDDDKTEKEDSKSKICDVSELRYGGIVSLCDQDVDGYHIKGLLINFFEYFWPSLLKIDSMLSVLAFSNIGPDAVKYNFCGVVPSCRNSLSVALSEKLIKSPAFTVVENEPENGGVIVGELLAEEHGRITICISLSTSEMRTPWRYDRALIFTK
jgi:DNA topoisomerase-2